MIRICIFFCTVRCIEDLEELLLHFDEVLFPDVSEHLQIVVCVYATDLAPDGYLEALLAEDLSLGRLLELLPHPVAVPFGVGQVA